MAEAEHPKYIECDKCEDEYSELCSICPNCNFDFIRHEMKNFPKSFMGKIEEGEYDVNIQDLEGISFLSYCILDGNISYVSSLLKIGADPNLYDCDHITPLYHAVNSDLSDITEMLIENGGDLGVSVPGFLSIRDLINDFMKDGYDISPESLPKLDEIAENYKAG